MRAATNWEAYTVVDASDGEKLELWNGVSLIRPDPQVLWKTDRTAPVWRTADARYHRSTTGGGKWEFHKKLPEAWELPYGDLKF